MLYMRANSRPHDRPLGYAGWGPSQLEQEMTENTWLLTPSSKNICFTPHEEKANAAANLLG